LSNCQLSKDVYKEIQYINKVHYLRRRIKDSGMILDCNSGAGFFSTTKYSKIPLIQLAQERTDAELSNIPDYQMVSILT
jgi:hypothetical protein